MKRILGKGNSKNGHPLLANWRESNFAAELAAKAVETISLKSIEGFAPKELVPESCFWSNKARFAIQIENASGGLQRYEEQIMLVKALNEEDAQRKLLPGFEHYAEPYLNVAGLLVWWQF